QKVSGVSNSFHKGNRAQFFKEADGKVNIVFEYQVDAEYLSLLNISLKEGQNFLPAGIGENKQSIIVNEAFLRLYDIQDPIGYQLSDKFNGYSGATIIGVTENYNFSHLRETVKPMLLHNANSQHFGHILVKIDPKNIDGTLAQLKAGWEKVRPEKEFDFSFLDEDIQAQYEAEARWNKVIAGATFMAIIISMLGLFGLIALTLAQRTKEIGVRKILGATVLNIIWMVFRQFVVLLLIATILSIPLVIYSMHEWLENFAYRIDIQWFVFVVSICLTTVLAFLVASVQSVKAASQNPVDALRTE
ncbi:MAG: FtsX-like permease family protein, partial [Bacteroidota bacterium]